MAPTAHVELSVAANATLEETINLIAIQLISFIFT